MDAKVRELARRAGLGDLNAAQQLVKALERSGVGSEVSDETLVHLANECITVYNGSHDTNDLDDLLASADLGANLAEAVLKYFNQEFEEIEQVERLRDRESYNDDVFYDDDDEDEGPYAPDFQSE